MVTDTLGIIAKCIPFYRFIEGDAIERYKKFFSSPRTGDWRTNISSEYSFLRSTLSAGILRLCSKNIFSTKRFRLFEHSRLPT